MLAFDVMACRLQPWTSHGSVIYSRPLVKAGQKVTCVEDGMPTWLAELMVQAPTVQQAISFVKRIEESLDIVIV